MSSSALRREAIPAAATIFCKRCSLRSPSGMIVIPGARLVAPPALPLRFVRPLVALQWVLVQIALLRVLELFAELLERPAPLRQFRPRPDCSHPALRLRLQPQPFRRPSFRTPPCWADRSHLSAQTGAETPWWFCTRWAAQLPAFFPQL